MSTTPPAAPAPWQEVVTPGRFSGQTVVVTGAGSGIGRATALRIAAEGGRLIASDLSVPRLDALVDEAPGLDIVPIIGDITIEEDVAKIVAAAGGHVDGLANIAGIADDFSPIHEVSDEMWERVFRVNVLGTLRLSRALVPLMLAGGSGSIVNISSEAGLRGSVAGIAYTASKHAVVGMTRHSAFMYGPSGIRTNAVAPGSVSTNIETDFGASSDLVRSRMEPLRAAIRPPRAQAAELAAAITFLLSRDSVNLNGVILPSDGGWSAI
ncbi:MAG: short-chain dehydrogenase/reductase [Microbacteriaceae bacterium]|jgi:NAD(P)-dependent dehydrogenase (short-subunit alcohol dehydrogenase family)|nr:short-chain dehydrogenase/reductase [Microbacteriaceae bacterium]